ncbi:hypothetical protein GJ688_14475 [Heliobacillus mobilis]|uniref:Uncharacterized protein n=1 Tax=Heliobacterium mobile TaxID=28064 RepID=A0A6I3SMN8_HELMO|nr:hypothetical protein [Heliobacterium mobile]MTV50179.1 hypothetical protein [Heliobacterium mobile]
MFRGKNPNRVQVEQTNHDQCVQAVASQLKAAGYFVLADHIHWEDGAPKEIEHCVPDIMASKDNVTTVYEIETCSTLGDVHTTQQLTTFSSQYKTVLVVPQDCYSKFLNGSLIDHAKSGLLREGLRHVSVAVYDPSTDKLNYR